MLVLVVYYINNNKISEKKTIISCNQRFFTKKYSSAVKRFDKLRRVNADNLAKRQRRIILLRRNLAGLTLIFIIF